MGCAESTCCHGNGGDEEAPGHNARDRPIMYMCAPGKDSVNYADAGDEIVLFVNFGELCTPCQLQERVIEHRNALERVRAAADNAEDFNVQKRFEFEVCAWQFEFQFNDMSLKQR